jgi:hypothetical protein
VSSIPISALFRSRITRGNQYRPVRPAYNWTTPALNLRAAKRPTLLSARSATMPPGGIAPPLFSPTRRPCLAQAGRTSGMNVQAPTSAETLPEAVSEITARMRARRRG